MPRASKSPIAAIIAHFATVSLIDARRDQEVIKAVLQQRERAAAAASGSTTGKPRARRGRRPAPAGATTQAAVDQIAPSRPTAVAAPSGPKQRRRRGPNRRPAGQIAAPAPVAEASHTAAPVAEALPPQIAGDEITD